MASAKLSTRLTVGNYGMSQNRCTDDSKEFIFVKMTDSAFRAIEEYQCNENNGRLGNGQRAKIQFVGNSGVIQFPTSSNTAGVHEFGFAIDAVEGGSLECIQQTHQDFDVIGSLAYRMRIHANDDVYDTTRTKMAIAEETEKSKCIREIKPNQTDIGRKVKKTGISFNHHNVYGGAGAGSNSLTGGVSGSSSNGQRNKLITQSNSPPIGGGGSAATANRLLNLSSNYNSSRSPTPTINSMSQNLSNTSASSLSSTLAGGITSGYASASSHNSPPKFSNTRGGSGPSNTKGGNNQSRKNTDVSKRNIRERLIHLLALKPYKKPELYSRLQNEGLKDRERSLISNILKDISTLSRDNTYNLRRQIWNDVNENWPFYNEQELQMVKRRKPQNLTPPMSSDAGSSTSGQSPSSTHRGSPPAFSGVSNSDLKRGHIDFADDAEATMVSTVHSKKQRISHFRKDNSNQGTVSSGTTLSGNFMGSRSGSNNSAVGRNSPSMPSILATEDSNSRNFDFGEPMDEYMTNPSDSTNQVEFGVGCSSGGGSGKNIRGATGGNVTNTYNKYGEMFNDKRRASPILAKETSSSPSYSSGNRASSNQLPFGQKSNHSPSYEEASTSGKYKQRNSLSSTMIQRQQHQGNHSQKPQQHQAQQHHFHNKQQQQQTQHDNSPAPTHHQSQKLHHHQKQQQKQRDQQQQQQQEHHHLSHQQQQHQQLEHQQLEHQQQQPQLEHQQQQQHNNSSPTQLFNQSLLTQPPPKYDFSQYLPITSIEQRRLYKSEFESDYDEYRKLLEQIQGVSRRFHGLAERLENVRKDCYDYNRIKQEIVSEYERIRSEEALIRNKQRFDYLHEKLAYIKKLVSDYDKSLTSGAVVAAPTLVQQHQQPMQPQPQQQQYHLQQQQQQQLHQQQDQHHTQYNQQQQQQDDYNNYNYHMSQSTIVEEHQQLQQQLQQQQEGYSHAGDVMDDDSDEDVAMKSLSAPRYSNDGLDMHMASQNALESGGDNDGSDDDNDSDSESGSNDDDDDDAY